MIGGQIKNEPEIYDRDEMNYEKVPYKLLCPQPMHPLAQQKSEVVEDLFINNGSQLFRGNSEIQCVQPCGLQQTTSSNMSFFPNGLYPTPLFSNPIRSQTIDNPYLLTSNPNISMAQSIQYAFQNFSNQANHNHTQPQSNQHIIKNGIRVICEIDMLLLKKFYGVKKKVFAMVNQKLPSDQTMDNAEWIKQRFSYRYNSAICNLFSEMVDKLEAIRRQKLEDDDQNREKQTYNVQPLMQLCQENQDFVSDHTNLQEFLNKISAMIERFLNQRF